MNESRDIDLLSAYLDGQLYPSDSTRLEARLSLDPELASTLNDLRVARDILRRLPARKSPRNFILTRKMVGARPPLPGAYSFFRFSSAFAALLLVLTLSFNSLVSRVSFGAAAPVADVGFGAGGCAEPCAEEPALQMPFAAATEAPVATEAPAEEMAEPFGTMLPSVSADSGRESQTTPTPAAASPKEAPTESVQPDQSRSSSSRSIRLSSWELGLLIVGLASALAALAIRQSAKRKWR